jgi:diguanylate cyclase (GGDEF)-like protein/PAS domain S-box-containing protein
MRHNPAWLKLHTRPLLGMVRTAARLLSAVRPSKTNHGRISGRAARRALSLMGDGVCVADLRRPGNTLVYVNQAFETITGYDAREAIGKNCRYLQGSDRLQPEIAVIRDGIERRQPVEVSLRNYRKDGTIFWNNLHLVPVFNIWGTATHYVGLLRDVTKLTEIASRLQRADKLDHLTGVANRNSFSSQFDLMLKRADGTRCLLVKVDVSQFHDINICFGYDVGDALLVQVAQRLGALPDAIVGRFSGDEFVVALPLSHSATVPALVSQIRDMLGATFVLPGATRDVRFSIGYTIGKRGDTSRVLLRQAGVALHESKSSQHRTPRAFDQNDATRIKNRMRLTMDLQQAIANHEFSVHLQPKIDLASGAIVGAEALLRWDNPVFGTQPPGRFIPAAEQAGLIVEIGAWVLRHTAEFAVRINQGRRDKLVFSVNVSQVQFSHQDVAQLVRTVIAETGIEPSWLMLELTETLLADSSPAMIQTLRELRDLGVGLSIDDFGTGYSSLRYLELFPVTEVKIDRCFVSDVHLHHSRCLIVDAVIRLGKELQIAVVAEGAEQPEEVAVLRQLGCPYVQGYFFGRPMPEANFLSLVNAEAIPGENRSAAPITDPSPPAATTAKPPKSRSVLLVDDDPLVLSILTSMLRELGWTVTTASSADAALALHDAVPAPDLLLTDVDLGPGMDGFALGRAMRCHWSKIRIMYFSGRPPPPDKLDALGPGEMFLMKPVTFPKLEAAVAPVDAVSDNGDGSA